MIKRNWIILTLFAAVAALSLSTAVMASSRIIETITGVVTVNQVLFHDDWSCTVDVDPGEKLVRKYFLENRGSTKLDVGFTLNLQEQEGDGITAEVDVEMFQMSPGDTHEVTVVFEAEGRAKVDDYKCEIELSRGSY